MQPGTWSTPAPGASARRTGIRRDRFSYPSAGRGPPVEAPGIRIAANSTSSALRSAGRRRNILWVRCSAALNQRKTAAIGTQPSAQRADTGGIEFRFEGISAGSMSILHEWIMTSDKVITF